MVCSFLLLSTIPFYGCSTVWLSIHQLMDIWALSYSNPFWNIEIYQNSYTLPSGSLNGWNLRTKQRKYDIFSSIKRFIFKTDICSDVYIFLQISPFGAFMKIKTASLPISKKIIRKILQGKKFNKYIYVHFCFSYA